MDEASIINSYRRYAGSYDRIFGPIFAQGRKQAVKKMNCLTNDRILEVGIGTGLAVNYYPAYTKVFGIDISPHMLAVARRNIARECAGNVCLSLMDAQKLCFPDNFFNKVSAMYVATVVPNPNLMMDEIKRVCEPDGDIFILNHFSSPYFLPSLFESLLKPLEKFIGFRPRFSMQRFIADNNLDVVEVLGVNLLGYWTLIHAKNRKSKLSRQAETVMLDIDADFSN